MKAFLLKFLFILMPYIIFLLFMIYYVEHAVSLKEMVFDRIVEKKVRAAVMDDSKIIVGGDSRAERQIVPAVILSRTGLKAFNIANAGADLVTLYNALKRYNVLSKNYVLIINVGVYQVNDGAIDRGYITKACLLNLSLSEKIWVYRHDLGSLWFSLLEIFIRREWLFARAPETVMLENGFVGIKGNLKLPLSECIYQSKTYEP